MAGTIAAIEGRLIQKPDLAGAVRPFTLRSCRSTAIEGNRWPSLEEISDALTSSCS